MGSSVGVMLHECYGNAIHALGANRIMELELGSDISCYIQVQWVSEFHNLKTCIIRTSWKLHSERYAIDIVR